MPRPDPVSSRAAVVSVHYYPEYVEQSLRHLREICERVKPERCVLVANNPAVLPALEEAARRSTYGESVLLHDNSGLEFGAYQAGVDRLLAVGEPDWTVILNDSFAIHQCFSRPMRHRFVHAVTTIADRDTPIVVGQLESLPRSFELLGLRTHRWITTNVFALNRGALRALKHGLRCAEPDELVAGFAPAEAFFSARLDPVLREHLGHWLFVPRGALSWYRAAPLDEQSAPVFARKARSILQEKYLSARLEAAGTIFVDIKQMTNIEKLLQRVDAMVFAIRRRHASRRRTSATSPSTAVR
jgi:hypothetical protein